MLHSRIYAVKTPDKPAYIMGRTGEVVTYKQLEERANRCSRLFRECGLRPKDSIAIFAGNHPRYLEVASAAQVAGLRYTVIGTYLSQSEIEYIVNDSKAQLLITSMKQMETAKALLGRAPGIKHRFMFDGTIEGYRSYEESVAGFPSTPIPEDIEGKAINYSSGTTGRPKGIIRFGQDYAFGALDPGSQAMISLFNLNSEAVYLSPAPLYHTAPLHFCLWTLRVGGTAVVMERFDPLKALDLIERYKITHSQWVPTMFLRFLKLPEEERKRFDVSSMQVAIHSAAPCPISVKEQMIDWWGPVIVEYYGASEANMVMLINSKDWLNHKGSVGRSAWGKIHVLDENGKELPTGESGHIYIEGGHNFEYSNDPEKTSSTRTDQGWTTVGDIGYIDEEGFVYLSGRREDLIISGGINVYPKEIEDVLIMHPQVSDVAVIGIPNEDFGEEVKAVMKLMNTEDASPELERELIGYCREKLSHVKCPKSIDFVDDLPRTETGKLLKRILKERYWGKK